MHRQTALITGCSSGFGKLIATTFHDNDWNVIATMRSPEQETDLASGEHMLATRLDVNDSQSIEAAFSAGEAEFGFIDTVVNNAGYGGYGLFEQASESDMRSMFETNLFGPINIMRVALPKMRASGTGTIINVTSMAGHMALPGNSIYSASKHAMVGLTEAMALEYRPLGIRIFSVAPGAYPTTRFTANTDKRIDEGDAELVAYSNRLREQINSVGAQMASESGKIADPQEVADRVYACATSEMPIHSPTGADAEMLIAMMGQDNRQDFLDRIGTMLVPGN
ncbi:SDR family oxidoreductase [Hoeflea sp. TYP-13]|uniref:SDR family oxidoreductase n=1 Tax=Hoeflea sp. TYP-13 TaxID=3230023 RepID=UPI0034C6A132